MVDVTVEIGAKIDKLIEGVDGARAQLSRLNDSMNLITGAASKMAEAIGIGLSVSGIVAFVEKMGEMGVAAERLHSQLGLSGAAISELKGIAKLSGVDVDSLAMTLNRLTLNVQRSQRDAFDPTNAALKVFGLNAKDLINLQPDQVFTKLAEAISKFEPSFNRSNAATILAGRSMLGVIAAFDKGRDSVRDFTEEWKKAGAGIDITKFASTHVELLLLDKSLQSVGMRIFAVLQPAINSAIRVMTEWVQTIKDADIRSAVNSVIDASVSAITAVSGVIVFLTETFAAAKTELASLLSYARTAASIASTLLPFSAAGKRFGAAAAITTPVSSAQDEFDDKVQDFIDDVNEKAERLKKLIADSFKASTPAEGRLQAPAMNLTGKRDLEIQKIRLDTQKAGLDEQLTQTRNSLDAQLSMERINADQRIALVSQATEAVYQEELKLAQRKAELARVDPLEYAKANAEIIKLQQKHSTEMQALHLQEITAIKDKYMSVLGTIQNAWDSQIAGLLAKTTTWAQAFKATLAQLAIEFIKWAEKKVLVYIAGEIAETSAATAGASARVGVAAGEAAAATGIKTASMIGSILASAQETFAGVFAFLSPTMGPAAAGPAAASEAVVAAQAALPSFAVGAWELPSDMIAQVHKGEMIVPAGPADAIRNGGGGASVYISTLDTGSMATWCNAHAGLLTAAVAGYQKNNPSSRGRY